MSLLPRRTNELMDSSNMRQERVSRIAQPTRRISSRRASFDRLSTNNQLNPHAISSGANYKRSVSATPMRTPMRTPNRSGRPTEFSSALLLTGEKDKKFIQEKALKINEYINKNVFKSNELLAMNTNNINWLKTMSIKQFIVIVNHFLKFIGGKSLMVNTNYVEQIPKIMAQIGYPHTINKSWLKTPTAPHAYNHIVILLDWLLFFAPKVQGTSNLDTFTKGFEYDCILPGKEFPDKDFTWIFLQKELEGFDLWNNNKDQEFKELQMQMKNQLLFLKTGYESMELLEAANKKIENEIQNLLRNRKVITNEEEFIKINEEIKNKQEYLAKLQEVYNEKSKYLKELVAKYQNKLDAVNVTKNEIDKLKNTVETQKFSANEKHNLLLEIGSLEEKLSAYKKSVAEIRELGSKNQITFARLIKKRVETISKFNSFINKIFSGFNNLESININDILLDQNSDELNENKIKLILSILEDLKMKNLNDTKYYKENIKRIQKEIHRFEIDKKEFLNKKFSDVNEQFIEIELKLESMENHYIGLLLEIKNKIEKKENEIGNLNKKNMELKILNEKLCKNLKEYEIENEMIFNKISKKADKMLTIKENNLKKFQECANDLDEQIRQLEMIVNADLKIQNIKKEEIENEE